MDQKTVREIFAYRDGELYWRQNRRRAKKGSRAGCVNRLGYRVIRFDNTLYLEHRLIFLYHHGFVPPIVDHIDRNRANNRIENIRAANKSLNKHNSKAIGEIPYRGVSRSRNKFVARILINGKRESLGVFDTPEDASIAYEAEAIKVYD